ncbi:MAG: ATP-grasp domain-containing protein [Gammaproteobacteria bacterium]|nr:ATP-grasp domain-containing protein [Gammaproteobacteria bacterium]
MRILVIEYITGGGLIRDDLPQGILHEAENMLTTLLRDLEDVADVQLCVSRDPRLPPLATPCEVVIPGRSDNSWDIWDHCMEGCDAVWPIMPETGGLLQRISEMALARDCRLIGSHPSAVAIAASKYRTAVCLENNGIGVVPTYPAGADIPHLQGRWVVKPDDGVGCEGICIHDDYDSMQRALQVNRPDAGCIAQPYLAGEPASLSMLCHDSGAVLLSANLQHVVARGNGFELQGIHVNGLPDAQARFTKLARAIARSIPGLWGYVGVDLLLTPAGPMVLEVNPRLTVSYAGLRTALAANVARLILDMLDKGSRLPACAPVTSETIVPGVEVMDVA